MSKRIITKKTKRKYIDNSGNNYNKTKDLSFESDLCYYTITQGRKLLYDNTNISSSVIDIILQYSAVYRQDHNQEYKFTSKPLHDDLIQHLLQEPINNNRISIVTMPRRIYGKTEMCINLLIKKEIECKEQNKSCKILVYNISSNCRTEFVKRHQALRVSLNEAWMMKDISIQTKEHFFTNNNFKIYFELYCDHPDPRDRNFDLFLVDESFFVGSDFLKKYFTNCVFKKSILTATHDLDRNILDLSSKIIKSLKSNELKPIIEIISITPVINFVDDYLLVKSLPYATTITYHSSMT